jgi:hypothetical protein
VAHDGALADGQADPNATASAIAGLSHAEEGAKDVVEVRRGNPGAVIPDLDAGHGAGGGGFAIQGDLDHGALRREVDTVPHDVLDGPADQLRRPVDGQGSISPELDRPLTRLELEARVSHDLPDERRQVDRQPFDGVGAALQPGEGRELADELVEAVGLLLDAIEGGARVLPGPLAGRSPGRARRSRPGDG